jgi:hypothetical protein
MSGDTKVLHLVTIAVFAAGVVAIGYVELRKWYKPAAIPSSKEGREMAVELHGEKSSSEVRASMKQDRKFWYRADSKELQKENAKNQGLSGMLKRMAP